MDTSSVTMHEFLMIFKISRRLAEERMVKPLIADVAAMVFDLVAAEHCMITLFSADGPLDVRHARHLRSPMIRA